MCRDYNVALLSRSLHSVLACLLQRDVHGIASRRSTSISFPQTSQDPYSPNPILASALFMARMSFCSFSSSVARTSEIASFCASSSGSISCSDNISRASSLSLWASKTSSRFLINCSRIFLICSDLLRGSPSVQVCHD